MDGDDVLGADMLAALRNLRDVTEAGVAAMDEFQRATQELADTVSDED